MKTFLVCLMLCLEAVSFANARAAYKLETVLGRSEIYMGSDITIEFRLLNLSLKTQDLSAKCSSTGAECDYVVTLERLDGYKPEKTLTYKAITGEPIDATPNQQPVGVMHYGLHEFFLKPGQYHVDTTTLQKMFSVTQPGTYILRARRNVPDPNGPGVVKSKAVTIVVLARTN